MVTREGDARRSLRVRRHRRSASPVVRGHRNMRLKPLRMPSASVDTVGMAPTASPDGATCEHAEVEFFGVKLKVRNPRLAALLNSNVTDDVQVIGRRARGALAGDDTVGDEERGVLHPDDSVTLCLDEHDEI